MRVWADDNSSLAIVVLGDHFYLLKKLICYPGNCAQSDLFICHGALFCHSICCTNKYTRIKIVCIHLFPSIDVTQHLRTRKHSDAAISSHLKQYSQYTYTCITILSASQSQTRLDFIHVLLELEDTIGSLKSCEAWMSSFHWRMKLLIWSWMSGAPRLVHLVVQIQYLATFCSHS